MIRLYHKFPENFLVSFSSTVSGLCVYYGEISVSCTILRGSTSPYTRACFLYYFCAAAIAVVIMLLLESFSHQLTLMVFHWSLSDSTFPQASRTLLSILADLGNTVVWMVSICPLTSKSSSPCNNALVTVPRVPITGGIIVTFIFQFFQFPSTVEVLILLFSFFQFYSVISRNSIVHHSANSLFFFFFFF